MQGITHNGQPTGYSNAPVIPGQAPESFPLQVPEGVSIVAASGSAPVYIYSTALAANLLEVTYAGTGSGLVTSFESLTFLGSDLAVQLSGNAPITKTIQLDSCTFVRNQIGLSCIETGAGTMNLSINECVLTPVQPAGLNPPAATTPPGIGIQLHADEAVPGQVPLIAAQINELQAIPGYGLMFEFPTVGNEPPDLAFRTLGTNGLGDFCRVIEVFATGDTKEHDPPSRIAEVVLDVNGGHLSGASNDWMVGIYATVQGEGKAGVMDYTAGYDISVTGSVIDKMAACGAFVTSFRYGRGLMTLQGGTTVAGTSAGFPRERGDYLQSGVHGFNFDGYLGIQGVNSSFSSNNGHGIYLVGMNANVFGGEPQAFDRIGPYPTGAYLRLFRCDLHANLGSGVMVSSGVDQFFPSYSLGPDGPSIAGGTWYESLPNSLDLRERIGFELPNGPGLIDRCRISNNGEHGVFALAYGRTNTVSAPYPATVSLQLVNSMIWNNPMGGFTALLSDSSGPSDPYDHGPTLLVPVVQCTLVGNGSSQFDPNLPATQPLPIPADWSLEVYEDVNWRGQCRYEWHYRPFSPGTPGEYLLTRVFNTILQRRIPNDPNLYDFGPVIEGGLGQPDASSPNQLDDWKIGVAGIRAILLPLSVITGSAEYVFTDAAGTFQGPINLTLHDAAQFLLTSFGPNNAFGNTPSWVWSFISAGQHDYSGNQRQQPIMNPHPSPEKGADEHQ